MAFSEKQKNFILTILFFCRDFTAEIEETGLMDTARLSNRIESAIEIEPEPDDLTVLRSSLDSAVSKLFIHYSRTLNPRLEAMHRRGQSILDMLDQALSSK